jgi:ABC-type antimicrobial peptide transport system permease subunit
MAATMTGVKRAVRELDPNLPIYRMRPMTSVVATSLARQRFAMQLLALFALVALVLAAIGTYGVMAYVVAQGTRELGIRLALGASGRGILALVLRQGLIVCGAGILIGLGAATVLTRILRTLIFGVDAMDPMTFATVAGLLTLTAMLATLAPALRASRIDPVISLRTE